LIPAGFVHSICLQEFSFDPPFGDAGKDFRRKPFKVASITTLSGMGGESHPYLTIQTDCLNNPFGDAGRDFQRKPFKVAPVITLDSTRK